MSPVIEALNVAARAWADLAWAMTWQSALLVGIVVLVAIGLRRSSPALRYWLWQITAIKLLLMPLWSVPVTWPSLPQRDRDASPEGPPSARSGVEIGPVPAEGASTIDREAAGAGPLSDVGDGWSLLNQFDWHVWLLLGWGLAVVVQVAAIARQRRRLDRLLRRTSPADDPELIALVAALSDRLGLRRPPDVKIADIEGSPFVCGLHRPALVLPRGLIVTLEPGPLRAVLVHELAHIGRHDLLWDWIPAIIRILYFFHPAAHYLAFRARLERELACDQSAMLLTGQAAAGYASTLVDVVSRSSGPAALLPASATARLDGDEPRPAPGTSIESL